MTEQKKEQEFCAGLIGQAIPDVAETKPRLNFYEDTLVLMRDASDQLRAGTYPLPSGRCLRSNHLAELIDQGIAGVQAMKKLDAAERHIEALSKPLTCHAEPFGCDAPHVCVQSRICTYAPVGSGNQATQAEPADATRRSAAQKD